MSTYPLDSVRYESRALRYWWAALPIACSLLGIVLFTAGIWSAIREWSPSSPLLASELFKGLLLVYSAYFYGSVGVYLTLYGVKVYSSIQRFGHVAVFSLRTSLIVAVMRAIGRVALLGLGLLLLEALTTIGFQTTVRLWLALSLWVVLRDVGRACRRAYKRTTQERRAIAVSAPSVEACPANRKCFPLWLIALVIPVQAIAGLVLIAVPLYFGYEPFAKGGINWGSSAVALGQLLLICTFLVGWTAFIHENSLVYRILYHTRHAPTRMAIVVDLVAVSLLLTAIFFSLSLSLALMQGS
jgi:hypothetical protein